MTLQVWVPTYSNPMQVSIISAITLAAVAVANADETAVFSTATAAVFPLIISAIGILASVIGIMIVRGKDGGNPASALNMGTYVSGIIVIIATVILSKTMLGDYTYAIAIIAGLVVGIAIGKITEVYTSGDYKSVQKIADQSQTGAATTIISGLGVGMMSTLWPILLHLRWRICCFLCCRFIRYCTFCSRYAFHYRHDGCS